MFGSVRAKDLMDEVTSLKGTLARFRSRLLAVEKVIEQVTNCQHVFVKSVVECPDQDPACTKTHTGLRCRKCGALDA